MGTILRIENFGESNISSRTVLSEDVEVETNNAKLENSNNFVVGEYIVLGEIGKEKSEIKLITAINGNTLTLDSNTRYEYSKGSRVTQLNGNQVRIYRASNVNGSKPTDEGDYSLLGTVDLHSDRLFEDYSDSTGGSDYWYLQTYYNEHSTDETDKDLTEAVRGGGYGRYVGIERVRKKAGIDGIDREGVNYYTDQEVDESIVEAQSEVDSILRTAGYSVPLETVPPLIAKVTRWLAVADLLNEAYDEKAEDTTKEGAYYRRLAERFFKRLLAGEIDLVDEEGNVISKTSRVDYQPDSEVSDFFFERDKEW